MPPSLLTRWGPEMDLFAIIWSKLAQISTMSLSQEAVAQFELFSKALGLSIPMAVCPLMRKRKLPFISVMTTSAIELKLPIDIIEFQLRYCGPYMERCFDAAPDPRVPFSPDAWQRKVLDAIDANKSLFVVAPTSAGKTFISFYAMKKILQTTDDGILVYVAPTKALVNQIAAEVQARFSKSYPHSAGRSVWAIHTRDYRVNNPTGCQILVTVPHILQIMLLAPSNAATTNSWSLRVKRIIFDEVHCIGQADDGVIWEQLLLLCPCPIIALSATVGNPLEFKTWLEASERVKGNDLDMILHSSRYSDLRKFIYDPAPNFTFRGLEPAKGLSVPGLDQGHDIASRFTFVHPVTSLINRYAHGIPPPPLWHLLIQVASNRGAIDDISLEPRDCLILWKCMLKHETKDFPLGKSLDPRNALPDIVKKSDVVEWETALKRILYSWMQDARSPFSTMRRELQSTVFRQPSEVSSPIQGAKTKEFSLNAALPLVTDLHHHGSLPAILFNYDRKYCEKIVCVLLEQLTQAEKSWKGCDPKWRQKIAGYETWKKTSAYAKHQKKKAGSGFRAQDGAGCSKLELMREEAEKESVAWESFDPDAPLDMFSFADRTKLLDSELDAIVYSLRFTVSSSMTDALRRGIGVHHAGMNRQYRQV